MGEKSNESFVAQSKEVGLLYGALAKAQGSYKKLIPNEMAAGGMFANLEAIREAVKDSLSANELAFYQYIDLLEEGTGAALLRTVLGHSSGQYISSTARVFSGTTDRQTGNTYEVHKRFHAMMILGIAPSPNDPLAFDDNGEAQEEDAMVDAVKNPKKHDKKARSEVIDKNQYNELMIALDGQETLTQQIQDAYGITTLADLPHREYHGALAQIRRIKRRLEMLK